MSTFEYTSDPPPRPLDTMPPRPRKDQTLKSPWSPSLGSHKLRLISHGLRANEPGGYAFPRSRRQTDIPACESLWVITDPPKPDPTTTTSKCASGAGVRCAVMSPCRRSPFCVARSAMSSVPALTGSAAGRTVGTRVRTPHRRGGSLHGRTEPHRSTVSTTAIFEPLRLGALTVKNRVFRSSVAGRFDNYDGSGTAVRTNWDLKFARGGVGAIISSNAPIHER